MQQESAKKRGINRPMIVAVDDDFRVRESVQSLLESAGYNTTSFASADEFLRSGMLTEAACVVTDVRMPGTDGIGLQRRIREQRPALPVIFISAHFNDETRQTALAEGAVEFFYKPFDAAQLLEVVHATVSKSLGRE